MKKFSFSLQKVLEIKEQILQSLKAELSSLNKDLNIIEEAINNLNTHLLDLDNEFINKSSVSISVGELTYYKMFINSLLKQIENKELEKQNVHRKLEAKRHEIINMNMEISGLDKLKEKELEKYNKAFIKNEEIFIEEFVSNKSITKGYAI